MPTVPVENGGPTMSRSWVRGGSSRWRRLVTLCIAMYGVRCHLCGLVVCPWCGRPGADTADHVIPKSRGGLDDLDNLRPAHRCCNVRRGDKPVVRPPLDLGRPASDVAFFKTAAQGHPALCPAFLPGPDQNPTEDAKP